MQKMVSFGEVMMRLTATGFQRIVQATQMDVLYAGSEANVAAALASWGIQSFHITRFPDNLVGKAAVSWLRYYGISTDYIQLGGERMGLFFVEQGAMARPTTIVYDRLPSAFSTVDKHSFDWDTILEGVSWFHWTGITPALSQGAADSLAAALEICEKKKITVSADVNYRSGLWKYGKMPGDIMEALLMKSQVVVASENDTKNIFGFEAEKNTENRFVSIAGQLMKRFPGIRNVVSSDREQLSASHNRFSGKIWNGSELFTSPVYDIDQIVERIGSGDAFIAGYIYGLTQNWPAQDSINFAAAAGVMKHTISGDTLPCSVEEIQELAKGNTSGRIKR